MEINAGFAFLLLAVAVLVATSWGTRVLKKQTDRLIAESEKWRSQPPTPIKPEEK